MTKRKPRHDVTLFLTCGNLRGAHEWLVTASGIGIAKCSQGTSLENLVRAKRIADCLNACMGIRNPATWRKRADKAMKALEEP